MSDTSATIPNSPRSRARLHHRQSHIPPIIQFNEVIEGQCGHHRLRLEVSVGLFANYYDGVLTGYLHAPWLSPTPLSIDHGSIQLFTTYERSPTIKYMEYTFDTVDVVTGKRFSFRGKKTMHPNRFPVWGVLQGLQETTTMNIRIMEEDIASISKVLSPAEQLLRNARRKLYYGKGSISWWQLGKMGWSMRGRPWDIMAFLSSFAGQLMSTYVFSPSFLHATMRQPIQDVEILMLPNSTSTSEGQEENDMVQLMPTTEGRFFTTSPLRLEFYTANDGLQLSYVYCPSPDRTSALQKPPILLYGGMSTRPLFWLMDTVPLNFGEYLAQAGYDVYVMSHRSGDPFVQMRTMESVMDHDGDDIIQYDIPAGVDHVIQLRREKMKTETSKVHLMGYCWGGVGIHGSILGGYVSSSKIASIVTMSSAPYFDIPPKYHYLKNHTPLLPILSTLLHATSGDKSYSFGRLEGRPWFEHVLRRVSSAMSFYTLNDPCSLPGHSDHWCTNFGLSANPPIQHDNVTTWTHARLPDCFGPASIKLLQHAVDCHRLGRLVPSGKRPDTYQVGTPEGAQKYTFPVTIVMGELNQVYKPLGGKKTIDWLLRQSNNAMKKELCIIPGYGHLDVITGKDAQEEVYGSILKHLVHADTMKRKQ